MDVLARAVQYDFRLCRTGVGERCEWRDRVGRCVKHFDNRRLALDWMALWLDADTPTTAIFDRPNPGAGEGHAFARIAPVIALAEWVRTPTE